MKSILKASALAVLLTLTSCAHHKNCCGDHKQCDMKENKECCKDSKQCDMKKDEAKTEAVKK